MIKIMSPIWNTRSIGIAEFRLKKGINEIEILHEDSFGDRVYPNTYKITREKAMTYPVQEIKSVRLRIIPIEDMEIK